MSFDPPDHVAGEHRAGSIRDGQLGCFLVRRNALQARPCSAKPSKTSGQLAGPARGNHRLRPVSSGDSRAGNARDEEGRRSFAPVRQQSRPPIPSPASSRALAAHSSMSVRLSRIECETRGGTGASPELQPVRLFATSEVVQRLNVAMTGAWSEPGLPRRALGLSSIDGNAPSAAVVVTAVVRLWVPETRIDLVSDPAWSSGAGASERGAGSASERPVVRRPFREPDARVREQGRRRRSCRVCREPVFVDQAAEQVTAADAIKVDHIGHQVLAAGRLPAPHRSPPQAARRNRHRLSRGGDRSHERLVLFE